jgi:hypothetical protein
MKNVIDVDAIEDYTNPETGKGWTPREEAIIAKIIAGFNATELGRISNFSTPRMEAIRRMRRRKLDDLKGKIRIVRLRNSPGTAPNRPPAAIPGHTVGTKTDCPVVGQHVRVSPANVGYANAEKGHIGETLDQYFARPDTPMPGSPVGTTMVRILAKYPDMTFDAARNEAKRLLDQAAGNNRYHLPKVLNENQKQASRERLAAIGKAA